MTAARWTIVARSYGPLDLPAILASLARDIAAINANRKPTRESGGSR